MLSWGIEPLLPTGFNCINKKSHPIKDGKYAFSSKRYILRNEKYKGCSLTQKSYNKDGMKCTNHGELRKHYMENTHEPIIQPDEFDKVQKIIYERCSKEQIGRGKIPPYPFTGLITCGCCGHKYTHKFTSKDKPWRKAVWSCSH